MRMIFFVPVFSMLLMFLGAPHLSAGEIDILVEKLVGKGVLTHGEAQQILTETKEEVRAKMAKGELDTLPEWVQKMNWKGDLRLRYQNTEVTNKQDRTRGRVRLRYGFDTRVNDQTKLGVRLATGTQEQTSTNQTFTGGFQEKDIWLDRAYLQYSTSFPLGDLDLIGGKMKNPFYKTDLVWDSDVTPEGVAFKASTPIAGTESKFFTNLGLFFLHESKTSSDEPTIIGIQSGISGKINNRKYKTAVAYYDFHNIKGTSISDTFPGKQKDTNTGGALDAYAYDFNILDINAEYTPIDISLLGQLLPLKLYCNFITNVADNVEEDSGWVAGFKLGKAKKPGSWQFGYNYREIQADAMVAELVDSDFHDGGTNSKGHKLQLKYALLENTTFGMTYFSTEKYKGSKKDVDTLQIDLAVKF